MWDSFISDKIKTERELSKIIRNLKREGKKVGLCIGAYDLLHPGHVKHFESAKGLCDILVVGVTSDRFVKMRKGPTRPVFNQKLRAYMISQLESVDYVFISQYKRAVEPILKLKPNFYIKGPDYINKNTPGINAERKAIKLVGGEMKYTKDQKFSTSEIIQRIKSESFDKPVLLIPFGLAGVGKTTILKEFCKKYKWVYINKDSVNNILLKEYDNVGNVVKQYKMFDKFYERFVKVKSYFLLSKLAYDNLKLGNNVVLDAYFSDKVDTELFKNILHITNKVSHYTIKVSFEAPKEIILKRLKKRNLPRDIEKIRNFEIFYKRHSTSHKKAKFDIVLNTNQPSKMAAEVLHTELIKKIASEK